MSSGLFLKKKEKAWSNVNLISDVGYINYANPVYGVATICHQVRCLRWGHPSPFHTATSFNLICNVLHERYIIQTYMDEIFKHAFCVSAIWEAQAFWLMNYCGFNIEPLCSDVWGDHQHPQTLGKICRNMGICCGFRAVAARGNIRAGLILLQKCINSSPPDKMATILANNISMHFPE